MYSLSSHHTFANTSIVLYLIYLGQDSLCQYGILIQYYYTSYHLLLARLTVPDYSDVPLNFWYPPILGLELPG